VSPILGYCVTFTKFFSLTIQNYMIMDFVSWQAESWDLTTVKEEVKDEVTIEETAVNINR